MPLTKQSGCKINLLLNILGKRDDGFHELETVMQPVPLHDELEFSTGGSDVVLTTNHPDLPCDGSNLIVKAAELFRNAAEVPDGVTIRLEKRIPMEAGMGGGSGNAATTLLGLNELFGQPLPADSLQSLAADLGSDVPFFLQDQPALATGRGERVETLKPFAALRSLTLVLVHSGFGLSTGWSYKTLANFPDALNGRPGRATELVGALNSTDSDWGGKLYNSLEFPAFRKYPVLQLHVEKFKELGAAAALMSGSGSTVYAFFDSKDDAGTGLEQFRSKFGSSGWSAIVQLQAAR